MRTVDSVVIQGARAPDDGLQIDLSGPAGPNRFGCPDCGHDIVFRAPGLLLCACQSVFSVERLSWKEGRAHYAVRRSAP